VGGFEGVGPTYGGVRASVALALALAVVNRASLLADVKGGGQVGLWGPGPPAWGRDRVTESERN
jgi:hypothetical protein